MDSNPRHARPKDKILKNPARPVVRPIRSQFVPIAAGGGFENVRGGGCPGSRQIDLEPMGVRPALSQR